MLVSASEFTELCPHVEMFWIPPGCRLIRSQLHPVLVEAVSAVDFPVHVYVHAHMNLLAFLFPF